MLYLRGRIYWAKWKEGGKLRRRSLGTSDLTEAQRLYDGLILERELLGDPTYLEGRIRALRPRSPAERERRTLRAERTVKAALAVWLRDVETECRPATLRRYAVAARQWQKRWGGLPLAHLDAARIAEWRGDRLREARSRRTVQTDIAVLRAFLGWATRSKLIAAAPAIEPLRGVARKRQRPAALEPEQVERLIREAHETDPALLPWLYLGAFAGLRRGEILALEWRDVDLKAGVLLIRPAKSPEAREVPIAARLADYLATLPREGAHVIVAPRSGDAVTIRARDLWKRAGLYERGKPTLHALRHSFATQLVRRGVDVETVRQLLGHSSVSVSEIYFSSSLDRKRAAVAAL